MGVGRMRSQGFNVQAKAVTHSMEQAADDELRGSIFPADPAHVPGAAFFGEAVAHRANVPDFSAERTRLRTRLRCG